MNWETGCKRNNVPLTGLVAFKLLSFSHFTKKDFFIPSFSDDMIAFGNHLPFWFYFFFLSPEVNCL